MQSHSQITFISKLKGLAIAGSALVLGLNLGCASMESCLCDRKDASRSAGASSSATFGTAQGSKGSLVLMTDFGLADGAVSAMKGVARATAPDVLVTDLTHEIPPYDIWDAAYRLNQTFLYWPAGTVFVSVIDPGVGSERKSIAVKTKSGHIFVGPDNGLLTFVKERTEIESIVSIDESKQRLKGSQDSYTFHGRDLYVYVGARLAAGLVELKNLGSPMTDVVTFSYQKADFRIGTLRGNIPVLDPNYGNVWTNIPKTLFDENFKDAKTVRVKIPKIGYDQVLPIATTFAGVEKGKPLVYFNSLMNLSIALNQGDFAKRYKVRSGADWNITVSAH